MALHLSPASPENPEIAVPAHSVLEQRRLAQTGLTTDDQDPAAGRRSCLDKGGEGPLLSSPAV
jgi:hypothetical protein